jgi:membrane protease subunit HflK
VAWNEPGKNGQNDPWNRKRSTGKSPLDDLLNKLKNRGGKFGQGSGGILTGVLVLIVVGLLFSSYTIIGARQQGVVLRFGQYSRTLPPGFHL